MNVAEKRAARLAAARAEREAAAKAAAEQPSGEGSGGQPAHERRKRAPRKAAAKAAPKKAAKTGALPPKEQAEQAAEEVREAVADRSVLADLTAALPKATLVTDTFGSRVQPSTNIRVDNLVSVLKRHNKEWKKQTFTDLALQQLCTVLEADPDVRRLFMEARPTFGEGQ